MSDPDNLGIVSTRLLAKHARKHSARLTPERRASFLRELERTCSVSQAAEASGTSEAYLRLFKRLDHGFAAEWEAALDRAFDPRLSREGFA